MLRIAPTAHLLALALALAAAAGCGAPAGTPAARPSPVAAPPAVRNAPGRPPVVVLAREGDPAAAVALAVTTAGIGAETADGNDDPEVATALAGLVEARLRGRGLDGRVTPSWDGLRVATLVSGGTAEATRVAGVLRDALAAPATETDVAAVRRKLGLLAQRPLRDRALAQWARCVGSPHVVPERAGRDYADVDAGRVERWRVAALGLGRVTFAVAGISRVGEAVANAIVRGPAWKAGAPLPRPPEAGESVDVFEDASEPGAGAIVHVTLETGASSAAVATALALGDPRGPLAARLEGLDLPFRLREVTGTANVRGGCVGVVLEAQPGALGQGDLAVRVADAVALVRLEARVRLESRPHDGLTLSARSGDAREAAELAAWWALAGSAAPAGLSAARADRGSITLGVPSRRGDRGGRGVPDTAAEPSRDTLAAAVARAVAAWEKPVVEGRSRIEPGQGQTWVLLASPCGAENESEADSGLTALFTTAAAAPETVYVEGDVGVEPWVTPDGVGILVHGPALPGEAPSAHARRLADIAARTFAAEPVSAPAIARARADLLRRDARGGSALAVLASALAPQHPSWIDAWGSSEPLARSSDAAVLLRGQALRAGPLRLAVVANVDGSQADAALQAADRWVARRTGETRACRSSPSARPPRPGTYAASPRPGAIPEAFLAFPFAAGDDTAYRAAAVVVAALADDGLLDRALGGMVRESSARIVGWPHAPALVVRVVASQASLDGAVMQTRALLDRIHAGGLGGADLDRALTARERSTVAADLDPRARLVATWRGEPIGASTRATADDVRAFAQKFLAEDAMIVVASRPPRPSLPTPPAVTP